MTARNSANWRLRLGFEMLRRYIKIRKFGHDGKERENVDGFIGVGKRQ